MTVHETLTRAASSMREAHGPEHKRHKMWAAIAEWLEGAAEDIVDYYSTDEDSIKMFFYDKAEYKVAKAYLEADPS